MQHQFLQIQAQVKDLRDDYDSRIEHQINDKDNNNDDNDDDDRGAPRVTASQASQQIEPPPPPLRMTHIHREPKLILLSPDDDIEYYLTTFERITTVCRWPKEEWAIQLIPLLTGKARSAYVLMDIADIEDYEKVKEVILAKYEITADTYRRRFRSLDINQSETPKCAPKRPV